MIGLCVFVIKKDICMVGRVLRRGFQGRFWCRMLGGLVGIWA